MAPKRSHKAKDTKSDPPKKQELAHKLDEKGNRIPREVDSETDDDYKPDETDYVVSKPGPQFVAKTQAFDAVRKRIKKLESSPDTVATRAALEAARA